MGTGAVGAALATSVPPGPAWRFFPTPYEPEDMMGDPKGDLIPTEALDGTRRMMRWDFFAVAEAEGALERETGKDVNFFEGVEVTKLNARAISVLVWAALYAADRAMAVKDPPRLSLAEVRARMTAASLEAVLHDFAAAYQATQPKAEEEEEEPATDAEGKAAASL